MNVFDTDMLTLFIHGQAKVTERVNRGATFVISIATRIEILQGRFDFVMKAATKEDLLKAQRLLNRWDAHLVDLRVLEIDDAVSLEFERLRANKALRKIGRGDLLIAAVTLANKATLITRNVKHFKLVPGLKYENWAD